MEENTIFIDGVLYKKIHSLNCRGCAFDGGPKQCFQPNLNCAKEEGGIIYKACKTAEYDKMWIDLSWVHGEAREVISKKIHELASSKGYNIKNDVPFIYNSSYLVLAYGILNHTDSKNVIDFLKGYSEISVNEALEGNFLAAEVKIKEEPKKEKIAKEEFKEKSKIKVGDIVCVGKKYLTVIDTTVFGDSVFLSDNYWYSRNAVKLCREKKKFNFYLNQRVYINHENTYANFIKHSAIPEFIYCLIKKHLYLLKISDVVPASLKERYEVVE